MLEGLRGLPRSLSHLGTQLVCCFDNGRVTIWDAAGDHVSSHDMTMPKTLGHVVATNDGMFVTWADDRRINLFDCQSVKQDKGQVAVSNKVLSLACSPDSREDLCLACSPGTHRIAFAGDKGLIGLFDPWEHTVKRPKIVSNEDHTTVIALPTDGEALVYASADMKIRVWKVHVDGYCFEESRQPALGTRRRRFGEVGPFILIWGE